MGSSLKRSSLSGRLASVGQPCFPHSTIFPLVAWGKSWSERRCKRRSTVRCSPWATAPNVPGMRRVCGSPEGTGGPSAGGFSRPGPHQTCGCRQSRAPPGVPVQGLGSLLSLGRLGTLGALGFGRGWPNVFLAGLVARVVYFSLHRIHAIAVKGLWPTVRHIFGNLFRRSASSGVKVH